MIIDKIKNVFVFVVCGSNEHINTLNFSLRYLNYFSKNEIIVVTDLLRNESEIFHNNILNIITPEIYNNHQASIFLKTSLHKILPSGNNYCYLDTDVIAISPEVDSVFDQYLSPITFAEDHCTMNKFSPHAVNCGCIEIHLTAIKKLNELFEELDLNNQIKDKKLRLKGEELRKSLELMRKSSITHLKEIVRFYFSGTIYQFKTGNYYNKKEKHWTGAEGKVILYDQENLEKRIEDASGLVWKQKENTWGTKDGNNIYESKCHHLREAIYSKFNIEIKGEDYQHWNGGVFLFNDLSFDFLELWHKYTMKIFEDSFWKTRDQGTLIATAWQLGLQNHKVLPRQFNFIADYNNPDLKYDAKELTFTDPSTSKKHHPFFMHVYHHFGEKGWDIWDYIERVLPESIQH